MNLCPGEAWTPTHLSPELWLGLHSPNKGLFTRRLSWVSLLEQGQDVR